MKPAIQCSIFFFLFTLAAFTSYGQQYEIRLLKELGKVDSIRYGTDSLITTFTSKAGVPLLRITEKNRNPQNNFEDSTVVFYNKNGLIEYSEMWQTEARNSLRKMKLTCRRYEYDDQNRVKRYVVSYPTPRTMEYTYTYTLDSAGNTIRNEAARSIDFWDEPKKTSIQECKRLLFRAASYII